MEGIGAVMPVENTMQKPQHFLKGPSILLIAMVTVTVLYTVMGLLGYIRFGEFVEGSVTLNLPTDQWIAITGQCLIGVAILFTFGLQFYIPTEILLKKIGHKLSKSRELYETLIRTGIMILMGALAVAIPNLEPFISLVGAVFFGTLGLLVPAFIEIVFYQENGGFGALQWKLWKNVFLILFSLVAMFAGAFVSVKEIIKIYTGEDEDHKES